MRFTRKLIGGSFDVPAAQFYASQKLGKLEDIEEELGIDLWTFMQTILKGDEGIYLKGAKGNVCYCDYQLTYNKDLYDEHGKPLKRNKGWYFESCLLGRFYLKDYGKTWALTKEELEEEQ